MDDSRTAWIAAAHAFADLVDRIPVDAWDRGSEIHDNVRDLTGHTCSAGLVEVTAAVGRPAERVVVAGPGDYYAFGHGMDPAVVAAAIEASAEDARRRGAELGDAPAAAVRGLVEEAIAAVAAVADDDVITTVIGGMHLAGWLPTRTFELAVHSLDLSAAAGVPVQLPGPVVAEALGVAAAVAARTGSGVGVLLALTGRAGLPDGFSVV